MRRVCPLVLFLAACGPETDVPFPAELGGADVLVRGRVVELDGRSTLPRPGTAVIDLWDSSLQDVSAILIARAVLPDVVSFPIEFELTGDASEAFSEAHRFIQARAAIYLSDYEIYPGDLVQSSAGRVAADAPSLDVTLTVDEIHSCVLGFGGECTDRVRRR